MIKIKFILHLLLALALLLSSGCAREQFEHNVHMKVFKQQNIHDQLESRTVQQDMFDSILTVPPEDIESTLGPGDLISVNVLESEHFNTETRVSSEGYANIPALDQIEVTGLTAAEAEKKIALLLNEKHLNNPHVSVFVKEKTSDPVTLIGSFTIPGNYDYVSGHRLLDIIAVAQGVTQNSAKIAYLARKDPRTGVVKNYLIDLDALMTHGDMNYNISLAGGDSIFIPEAGQCFVDGAVKNPGAYSLRGEMSITEAIILAGGLTAYTDNDQIKLIRHTGKGKRNITSISISELQEGLGDNIKLQDQDIIYAESSSSGLLFTGLGFDLGFIGTTL
jgi:polysaccharide export outer membrane protein